MKNINLIRFSLLLLLVIGGTSLARGYNRIQLRSDYYTGGWSYTSGWFTYGGDGKKYWDVYHTGDDSFWRINIEYYATDYGPSTNNYVMNVGTTGYKVDEKNSQKAFKTTGNAGILRICTSQYGDGATDEYPIVWVERPGVVFKHPWNGSSWTEENATDNQDGTYTYKGTYGGTEYFNAKSVNGAYKVAKTSTTVIGSPATGERCEFKWTPSGYKLTGDEEENRGVFVITKLCKIQYDGNGKTGGSVPSDQEDIIYNTATIVRGNDGSLVKTNYHFNGWNTQEDGKGIHYDAGSGVINPTDATTTLYAEWVPQWCVKGSGSEMGSWDGNNYIAYVSGTTHSGTITLAANKTYEFKVYNLNSSGDAAWYGYSTKDKDITFTREGATSQSGLANSKANLGITTDIAGIYTFTWNTTGSVVTVTYPSAYKVTYNGNDNTGGTAPAGVYYAPSATVTVAAEPTSWAKTGYSFGGWNTTNDGSGNNYAAGTGTFTITANTSLYAKWTQSVTLDDNGTASDFKGNGSVTATYNKTSVGVISAPTRVDCTVDGYYAEPGCTNKVMEADGTLVNYTGYVSSGKWIHSGATTLYTKWKSTNFVIYRSGDKSSDGRRLSDQYDGSYAGGTISKIIEYRMQVHALDQWETLCLPFTVTAVKVWDETDGAYYDLKPYYRTGGKYYTGHYILRTPSSNPLSITDFENWVDPSSSSFLPSANTPYIIQWHDSYFSNKFITFYGSSGQTIPTSMTAGSAPVANNVVNVCSNDAMVSGSVTGAYLLESDYGSDGAWLRGESASESRTIAPFTCYLRANEGTTAKYRVMHRGMSVEDEPTGWEDVVNSDTKAQITVYTLTGFQVAHFENCSFNEASHRLRAEHNKGIYILRSENKSVKLVIGE